jgi:RNA polymerase sigma-70 factor (ECF subfamily)
VEAWDPTRTPTPPTWRLLGDREAVERLLRRHQARLLAVCRRLTGSDSDAADALQEAMIALVRGIPRFDGRSRFGTWAYRVAVNASYDELRRRRRQAARDLADPAVAVPADAPDAGDAAAARADVGAALAALSPEFRAAVVLRDACGLDYAEIAEVLGVPIGTVRSRIARGRAALVARMTGSTTSAATSEGRMVP